MTNEKLYDEYYEEHFDELHEEAMIAFYETGANYENVDEEKWLENWIETRIKNILNKNK